MRKKRVYKKHYQPDIMHNRVNIGRFINYLMRKGKKTAAEKILYGAFDNIKKEVQKDPVEIFEKALENAAPLIQVVSKRIGGANYQIPKEVRPERKFFLACQWIIKAAKAKKGKPMAAKLAEELLAASKNEGAAIKKKQDTHRMAEANRAFAHFAR
ncbi:MAG: 30S ribosomal protein S7 [Patescibacteria group bacterium]